MSITVILKKSWSWSELRLIFGRVRNDENLDFSFVKFSNSSFLRPTPKIRLALKSTFFILWDWNCIYFHHLYVYIGWCTQIPKFQPRRAISRGGVYHTPPRLLCNSQRASLDRVKIRIRLGGPVSQFLCNIMLEKYFTKNLNLYYRTR